MSSLSSVSHTQDLTKETENQNKERQDAVKGTRERNKETQNPQDIKITKKDIQFPERHTNQRKETQYYHKER